jgi:hypothetical protein
MRLGSKNWSDWIGVADTGGLVDEMTGEGCNVLGGFNVGIVILSSEGVTKGGFTLEHPPIKRINITSINLMT